MCLSWNKTWKNVKPSVSINRYFICNVVLILLQQNGFKICFYCSIKTNLSYEKVFMLGKVPYFYGQLYNCPLYSGLQPIYQLTILCHIKIKYYFFVGKRTYIEWQLDGTCVITAWDFSVHLCQSLFSSGHRYSILYSFLKMTWRKAINLNAPVRINWN